MGVPANVVQAQGQGAVSADQANTWGQTCDNLGQLRDFVGVSSMWLLLKGYSAPADGGQAFYRWDSNATGPDNGTTIIQPVGQTVGAWIRIPIFAYTAVILTWTGPQTASSTFLGGERAEVAYTLPAGLIGSQGLVPETLPTASYTVSITKNGVQVATATCSTLGAWTFVCAADVSVAIGDQIRFIGPGDATIADFGLTLKVRLS